VNSGLSVLIMMLLLQVAILVNLLRELVQPLVLELTQAIILVPKLDIVTGQHIQLLFLLISIARMLLPKTMLPLELQVDMILVIQMLIQMLLKPVIRSVKRQLLARCSLLILLVLCVECLHHHAQKVQQELKQFMLNLASMMSQRELLIDVLIYKSIKKTQL
jgi:hypothetical protein